METDALSVEPVVMDVHLPEGMAGPFALDFDVRCFLVPHADGVVLIDTAMPGSVELIGSALTKLGADWTDISDVLLTHGHQDHIGGLQDVVTRARSARVWAGPEDHAQIGFEGRLLPLSAGTSIRGLTVMETPGHTPGHRSLLHEEQSMLFPGDVVGSNGTTLVRSPAAFTADAIQAERTLLMVAELEVRRVLFSHGGEIAEPIVALQALLPNAG